MGIFKTTAAVLAATTLIGSASVPAKAGETNAGTGTTSVQVVPTTNQEGSLLAITNSILRESVRHEPQQRNCKPGRLYSEHDVVGDPKACFLGNMGPSLSGLAGPG
jgi:hypothetical protein